MSDVTCARDPIAELIRLASRHIVRNGEAPRWPALPYDATEWCKDHEHTARLKLECADCLREMLYPEQPKPAPRPVEAGARADRFMSPDEIVDHLVATLRPDELQSWLDVESEAQLVEAHHGTGRWIRNYFRLWDPENPYTNAEDPVVENGVITDPKHPDNLSGEIMVRLWRRLRELAVRPEAGGGDES